MLGAITSPEYEQKPFSTFESYCSLKVSLSRFYSVMIMIREHWGQLFCWKRIILLRMKTLALFMFALQSPRETEREDWHYRGWIQQLPKCEANLWPLCEAMLPWPGLCLCLCLMMINIVTCVMTPWQDKTIHDKCLGAVFRHLNDEDGPDIWF